VDLVQGRIVTDDVARLAAFYARLVGTPVPLNDYYVEVQAGPASVGFCKRRFTEQGVAIAADRRPRNRPEIILDFLANDVDAEYQRIRGLGVELIMRPTTQPWGNRSMMCADPEGTLISVFSRRGSGTG
jgi:predicted enzyme related to lactoylglutathione lyase